MRLVVTGRAGQVVSALIEAGERLGVTVLPIGRPELDLAKPATVGPAIAALRPDIIVSAAAYTAVDKAESDSEAAHAVNAVGAGVIAAAARDLGVPIIHMSTDYVFDGNKVSPYVETDPVAPLGVYGRTKLEGEQRVAAYSNHVILRTAWVYSPFGANFLRTMLRLAETRDVVRVVADQLGNPTSAFDIADGILRVARNVITAPTDLSLRGTFHLVGQGDATWADFATAIFTELAVHTGRTMTVERITTADYPTPARRPANSRLDTTHLRVIHGVVPPDWRLSLTRVTERLLSPPLSEDTKS